LRHPDPNIIGAHPNVLRIRSGRTRRKPIANEVRMRHSD
jgi:hypothetical protein